MADTPEKTPITMTDGRIVGCGKKARLLTESTIGEDGSVTVRLDFVNGETRSFALPSTLFARFAAHGAEQKLGDAIAGETDINDAVEISKGCPSLNSADGSVEVREIMPVHI